MTLFTIRGWAVGLTVGLTSASGFSQQPPTNPVVPASATRPADGPAELTFEDQFGRKAELATVRGFVTVLVYGDRNGTEVCREYGEHLHTLFHPTAKGQPPEKARQAPVVALAGVPAGKASPDVVVVPVACAGKVPGVVKDIIQSQVKKVSPSVTVWMDFVGTMEQKYGMRAGDVNLVVVDAAGHVRLKVNGTPDRATGEKLVQTIQNLRAEAAGLNR